jgi:hypothetical protein
MFKPANKSQSKARICLYGPSGSGKTYSALRVATGLASGGKIAVIDTERGSAAKYSDKFTFDACDLKDRTVNGYLEAIHAAGEAGYAVLIIDSMTHGWHELLAEVEKLAQAKYRGNTWSAWSEGTPKQNAMIDALLNFPGHVIATMRAKTEWQTASDERGRTRPVRVGLAPEQGKGIEYEFDLLMSITPEHIGYVEKDRSGQYQDQTIEKPDEAFGQSIAAWLAGGTTASNPAPAAEENPVAEQVGNLHKLLTLIKEKNITAETQQKWLTFFKVDALENLSDDAIAKLIAKLETLQPARAA